MREIKYRCVGCGRPFTTQKELDYHYKVALCSRATWNPIF